MSFAVANNAIFNCRNKSLITTKYISKRKKKLCIKYLEQKVDFHKKRQTEKSLFRVVLLILSFSFGGEDL